MIVKKALCIAFAMLIAVSMINGVAVGQVPTSVDAPMILDTTITPGSTIAVDITVTNVNNMWGYQFILYFDPAVLTAVSFQSKPPFTFPSPSEVGPDYVAVAYSMPFGTTVGFTGTTVITTIAFDVNAYGWSFLDLNGTVLVDVSVPPQELPHEEIDGLFANIQPQWMVNLVRRSAWPEHHSWVESKDADLTLTGRLKNIGSLPSTAKVVFTIANGDGLWQNTVETTAELVLPGKMVDQTKIITAADLNPSGPYGTYYVKAQAWYDSDGDGIIDAMGAKVKSFSFAFKP